MNSSSPEVLLAHAYFIAKDPRRLEHQHPLPPLQPKYVAAWLVERVGSDVSLWDPTFRDDVSAFEVHVSRKRPRVTWIYTHPTTRASCQEMIRVARRAGSVVIAAGPDATLTPQRYLDQGADMVVPGEGEAAAEGILRSLRANGYRYDKDRLAHVPGVVLSDERGRASGPRIEAPLIDIHDLPRPLRIPATTAIHLERWDSLIGYRPLALASSRGAPQQCPHCSSSVFGATYRRRDPDDVIAEMGELTETHDVNHFVFADDVFARDPHWISEFCEGWRRLPRPQPFEGFATPSSTEPAAVRALADSGCMRLELLAVSGSERLLRELEWRHRTTHIYRLASEIRDAGMRLDLTVLLGLPGETPADLAATLEMVRVINPDGVETIRVDPGSPAHYRKDWEWVVGPHLKELGRERGTAPLPLVAAADTWLRSFGVGRGGVGTPRHTSPQQRVLGPILRTVLRHTPWPWRG